MLVKKPLSQRRKIIYFAIVLVNFSIAGYLGYTNLFQKPTYDAPAILPDYAIGSIPAVDNQPEAAGGEAIKPGTTQEKEVISIFEDSIFNSLKNFGKIPIEIGIVGNEKLFDLFEVEE